MKLQIISQIVIPILVIAIGSILEVGRRQLKSFLNAHKDLIEKQKEALKQSMGIEQYNKDVSYLKGIVKTVEQLGKEYDWSNEVKHSKVLTLIEGKTGLSEEDIFNIIKETVLEVNNMSASSK